MNLIIGNLVWHIPALLTNTLLAECVLIGCIGYRFYRINITNTEVIAPIVSLIVVV